MKRMLIMVAIAALTVSMSFGQFTEGTKSAGGTLGWSSYSYDGDLHTAP